MAGTIRIHELNSNSVADITTDKDTSYLLVEANQVSKKLSVGDLLGQALGAEHSHSEFSNFLTGDQADYTELNDTTIAGTDQLVIGSNNFATPADIKRISSDNYIKSIKNKYGKLVTNGSATGAVTLDLDEGDVFALTLIGNVTDLSVTPNPSTFTEFPVSFAIRIKQGASGPYTIAFNNIFKTVDGAGYNSVLSTMAVGDVIWFYACCVEPTSIDLFMSTGPLK